MKRFMSMVLLLMLLFTAASADVRVQSLSTAHCAAFSLDGQHCLMLEPLPGDSSFSRMYIRHADGSVTDIEPTGLTEQDPLGVATYFERCRQTASGIKVCGNTLLVTGEAEVVTDNRVSYTRVRWLVNMVSGKASLLRKETVSICGSRAVIISNTYSPSAVRALILDGNSGTLTDQPLPDGLTIYGACALENGVLLSIRTGDGGALVWLDSEGNEVHRLACAYAYDYLYYDNHTKTGLAGSNSGMSWSWFNLYMIMQIQLPDLASEHLDTKEGTVVSTQFYVSLIPETAKAERNFLYPLGMTDDGLFLLNWNRLGWLSTLNTATMQLTPLISASDTTDEVMELGHYLYESVWNGSTIFCRPYKLQPCQYIVIDHPGLH